MRILIVAATGQEVGPIAANIEIPSETARSRSGMYGGHTIDVIVTGVGMVATAAWCTDALARQRYDLALNLGVCGSFDPALSLGRAVHVVADRIAELGAEDGDAFLTIHDLGLLAPDEFPFAGGQLVNRTPPMNPGIRMLPAVHGITVNTVHGRDESIAQVAARFAPQVESMEGAAFMYACLVAGVPFAQVRAVSNVVEWRNRAAWNIPGAIDSLGSAAMRILDHL